MRVFTEMPSGMQSRGFTFKDDDKASKAFDSVCRQLLQFNLQDETFECSAIIHNENGEEVARCHVARLERK